MKKLLILLGLCASAYGSLSTSIVWELRPGSSAGSDSNGGCFDTSLSGGTDYSQQNSAQYNFTDLVIGGTTTNVTSASHSFVTADVGNCIHISAGSGFTTGWFEIASVSGGTATLDRSAGSGSSTGGTYYEGGALNTFSQLNTNMTGAQAAWVKANGTISVSSSTGFNFSQANGTVASVQGYTSTRGDGGVVTVQASTSMSNNPVFFEEVPGMILANFIFDCNSQSTTGGFLLNGNSTAMNIKAENCVWNNGYGVLFNGNSGVCINCQATNIANGNPAFFFYGGNGNYCIDCVAYSNSVSGFAGTNNGNFFIRCISANNSGGSSVGFFIYLNQSVQSFCQSCVAYGNGSDGFQIELGSGGYGVPYIQNSVSYSNGGYGFNSINGTYPSKLPTVDYNAYGSNTSGDFHGGLVAGSHDVTLSADPFVAGSSNNFALSSGGITAIGGRGYPGVLPTGGTGYLDIGVLQHTASGGGGGQVGFPIVQ